MAEKLDDILTKPAPGSGSAEGALGALGAAETAAPAAAGTGPGEPGKPAASARALKERLSKTRKRKRGPRSKQELKAELREAKREAEELAAQNAALQPPEDGAIKAIAMALTTMLGILQMIAARVVGEDFACSKAECEMMAEALAPPMLPWYGKIGPAMPWVGAALVCGSVLAPKVEAHVNRKKAPEATLSAAAGGPGQGDVL